jgi:hypothetical protein
MGLVLLWIVDVTFVTLVGTVLVDLDPPKVSSSPLGHCGGRYGAALFGCLLRNAQTGQRTSEVITDHGSSK